MVIDSLFQKRSQNLPVYLQMYPPRIEKVGFQVKVTFLFWLMYPPPPTNTQHECYRNNNHFKRGHQVHFTNLLPLPLLLSDSMPEQETGEFQFQMAICTRTPSTTLLQPKKIQCLFLDYIQLLMISRAGQWTQTPSATPLQPKKLNVHFWITFNF